MHVVAAGVHLPRQLGRERQAGLLVDRQRVHVGADADRAAGPRALQHRDHAGLPDAGFHGQSELLEEVRYGFRRLMLLERELGMLMEALAQRGELGSEPRRDLGDA